VSGFVTEKIRESGRRLGFAVERLGGERGVLARIELPGPPRVGRYGVDRAALERRRGIELLPVTTADRNELPDLLAARLRTAR
jgi:nucleoside-triphosphatase